MNTKNTIIIAVIIFVISASAIYFYFSKPKEEPIQKITVGDILEQAKITIGVDLNIAPEIVRWNTKDRETTMDGKGCLYTDTLKAQKLSEIFGLLDDFLKEKGFANDQYNQDINEEGNVQRKYINGEVVCNLLMVENSNNTSSAKISCANIEDLIYNFDSDDGKECAQDSDCGVLFDSCARARVCRNINYKFYNDCENPSALIKDIDFSVANCQCIDNQCVPKKAGENGQ